MGDGHLSCSLSDTIQIRLIKLFTFLSIAQSVVLVSTLVLVLVPLQPKLNWYATGKIQNAVIYFKLHYHPPFTITFLFCPPYSRTRTKCNTKPRAYDTPLTMVLGGGPRHLNVLCLFGFF